MTVKYMERCLVLRLCFSELIRKQINDSRYKINLAKVNFKRFLTSKYNFFKTQNSISLGYKVAII
jgi:hypothetical protein